MLYTASFYDPEHWKGQRYRVSRAHPRGMRAQWDTAPFLYPPRELLRDYRAGTLDFVALSLQWVQGLGALADMTLLCFERGETQCHRRVAANWLLERASELRLGELR